ncbi:hypothetical protein, partial [Providencia rettgeri]
VTDNIKYAISTTNSKELVLISKFYPNSQLLTLTFYLVSQKPRQFHKMKFLEKTGNYFGKFLLFYFQ